MRRLSELIRAKREHDTSRIGSNVRATEPAAEGFSVERAAGVVTVRWGANRQVKDTAAKRVLAYAVIVAFAYVIAAGTGREWPHIFWVFLLPWLYLLLVAHVNHMTIRATDTEWKFRRGPLPTLDIVEKTVNPTRCHQVTSSAVVARPRHQSWTSYDLWMKSGRGLDLKVLSGLNAEQADYLVQVLQPLLAREESAPARTGAPSRELGSIRAGKSRSLPAQPAAGRTTAAPRILAVSEDKSASATLQGSAEQGPIICTACDAANPVESAFCGECGLALVASGV